jgi:hypothetical protein
LRLDPSRDAAWRRLGYKKQGNRWVKPEEVAALKAETERQKRADKLWKSRLEKLRDGLENKDPARRARAELSMAEVTDPRAVPMIWTVLLSGSARARLAAVQMLGQIDGPAASTALGALAILYAQSDVQARAIETLTRRDPRDIVGWLISMIRKPFKYQVRPINGPGSVGELFVEGERFNVRRLYRSNPVDPALFPSGFFVPPASFDPTASSNSPMPGGPILANQPNSSPGMEMMSLLVAQAFATSRSQADLDRALRADRVRQGNQALEQRLAMDIRSLEVMNGQIHQLNDRVLPVVKLLTGQDLGAEPRKWQAWWTDQLGYALKSESTSKPTFTDLVETPAQQVSSACFGPGTLVRALDGPRSIESIQIGDRVLSQDTTTGALTFQPVVAVHRTAPTPTLRITIDGETIVATGIHRFWKAGKGWTMARELNPGDRIRVIGGVLPVQSVKADATVPVYNLDVAEHRNFFIGAKAFLVHDYGFVQPVLAPFDRQPELVTAAR